MPIAKHKSASVLEGASVAIAEEISSDQRAMQTCRKIDSALHELLRRRSYDNLRVSDITRKAAVGRSTFYAHYTSKDDLLKSQFFRNVAPMIVVTGKSESLLDCTLLFAHIKAVPRIFQAIMGSHPWSRGAGILRECVEKHVDRALLFGNQTIPPAASSQVIPRPMIASFVSHGLIAVIEFSLRSGREQTPQQLQVILHKLVGTHLRELVDA